VEIFGFLVKKHMCKGRKLKKTRNFWNKISRMTNFDIFRGTTFYCQEIKLCDFAENSRKCKSFFFLYYTIKQWNLSNTQAYSL